MQAKEGVQLYGLQIEMRKALMVCDKIYSERSKELVITSTVEAVHSASSMHPYGYAIDIRTNYFTLTEKIAVSIELEEKLGASYKLVWHGTHFHIEYIR